jgi:hypothetical protein
MDITKNTDAPSKVVLDLNSINLVADANAGAEIELHHPITGADLGIKVSVVGRDSDRFKEIQTAQNRKRMSKIQKFGMRASGMVGADADTDGIELLAACTTGWTNMVMGGREVPFTVANAAEIYTLHPWIKEQVDVAIADRALFTKA